MAGWYHQLSGRWVWVNSGSWWWTGRPGVLWFMGSHSRTQLKRLSSSSSIPIRVSFYRVINFTWTVACQAPQFMEFSKPGFSNTWTVNFLIFKLVLEEAEEPEIKLPTSAGSWKKQESSRKTSISALLTIQSLWLRGSQQTVENYSRDGNTGPPYLPPEKPVCRSGSNS